MILINTTEQKVELHLSFEFENLLLSACSSSFLLGGARIRAEHNYMFYS